MAELIYLIFGKMENQVHVAPPKAVYRLLGISHNQVKMPKTQGIVDQRQQISKLQLGSILKLIDQDVVVLFAQSFKNKGYRLPDDDLEHPAVEVGYVYLVSLPEQGVKLFPDFAQQR
jgi:hypothetical protein